MARSKMEMILEDLAHVISDETTAAMTGPIATPLGQKLDSEVPAGDEPEGTAPLGKGTEEPGGDVSFYDKEQKKSDFPYAQPGQTESDSAPKIDDPEGKAVLGKGTAEKGGDASNYGDEKTDSKYPHEFDTKKGGVKTEQDDPLAELEKLQRMVDAQPGQTESDAAPKIDDPEGKAVLGKSTAEKGGDAEHYGDEKTDSKYPHEFDTKKGGVKTEQDDTLSELEKLQRLAEEDPTAPPSEPVTEPAVPALDGGEPSADAPEEPVADAPEEINWELYLHSGDFDLISDRAGEVLKPIADAQVSIAVKFAGDESKKNEVIDAFTASGFVVLDVEQEGASEEPEDDAPEGDDVDVEVIDGPAPAVAAGAPVEDPAVMAEARRRKAKAKKRKLGKR